MLCADQAAHFHESNIQFEYVVSRQIQSSSLGRPSSTTIMSKRSRSQAVIWHNRPTAHITCLYPEILALIFGYLDVKDKGRAAQVCSTWREACYHKSVWRGQEAKIHVRSGESGEALYASLIKRGIKKVQILSVRKSVKEVINGVYNVEHLSLSGCFNLQDSWLTSALTRHVPFLIELNLSMCKPITDNSLNKIANYLKSLETLDLGGCSNVTNNGLSVISKGLPKLKYLNLRSCHQISDTGVGHLARTTPETETMESRNPLLEYLGLQDCQKITDDALRHISTKMKHLKSINLSFCASITDFGLKHLSTMSTLREINLRSCDNITDSGLAHLADGVMRELQVLDVSFSKDKIGDQGLTHISQKLAEIKSLSLIACSGITDEGLTRMAKGMLQLNVLNLGQCNKITDKGLSVIAENLVNLTNIDLYGCSLITTVGMEKIMSLPNLKDCNLELWQKQQLPDQTNGIHK